MAIIPYANVVNVERLPIDAQDIVTKVRLVIAGNRAGRPGFNFTVLENATSATVDYAPAPITFEYQDAAHATYGCERSFALPEGFNPFLPPESSAIADPVAGGTMSNPGTPSAVRDGDPTTFATLSSFGSVGTLNYDYDASYVGFRLKYKAKDSAAGGGLLIIHGAGRAGGYQIWSKHRRVSEGADTDTQYYVLPHDARNQIVNTPTVTGSAQQTLVMTAATTITELEVYDYYPLVLDAELLEDVAKSNIRLPGMIPQRVTVNGIIAPDREHTITGWPGGDYTGAVAQHQYELGRTVIDFEQAGAPTGLPAEAVEAARERTVAVKAEIERRSYSIKMGERQ